MGEQKRSVISQPGSRDRIEELRAGRGEPRWPQKHEGDRLHLLGEPEGGMLRHMEQLTTGTLTLKVPRTHFHVKRLGAFYFLPSLRDHRALSRVTMYSYALHILMQGIHRRWNSACHLRTQAVHLAASVSAHSSPTPGWGGGCLYPLHMGQAGLCPPASFELKSQSTFLPKLFTIQCLKTKEFILGKIRGTMGA